MVILILFFLASLLISSTPARGNICSNDLMGDNNSIKNIISQVAAQTDQEHYHLTPTDDSTWMDLLPRKAGPKKTDSSLDSISEHDWAMVYRTMKRSGMNNGVQQDWDGGDFLREISLEDVRLDPESIHGRAQQTNLEYLLFFEPDRLVWTFRKNAGLPTVNNPYGGWEKPDGNLRGHFIGHYMSASALMWSSTHNETLRQNMNAVVDALDECQKKIGTGYLSAFPTDFFDKYERVVYVWAPYYTVHKIMAGLLDQYMLAGNAQALRMVTWMVEYFGNRIMNVIKQYTIARHWRTMNEETGGLNDLLYKLYTITGNEKHLILAHLFDKPCLLGQLAVQANDLAGLHANTHIPIVVGAQKRYEVTGDPIYREIGTTFMEFINASHVYATGGTGVNEFWVNPNRLSGTLGTNNEESCTTYNMLKIARNLFRWTRDRSYADYYERALTNGLLSIQRGREPGVMIYFIPMMPGGSKAISGQGGWGTKNDTFWCCYGTGIESFSKMGDSIYFEEQGDVPKLYIIQFISSTINWRLGGIQLHQQVDQVASYNQSLQVTYTISANESAKVNSTLNIRLPFWTSNLNVTKATLCSQDLQLPTAGDFLSITHGWCNNDRITLQLPISLRTESILDDRPENTSSAVLFGPYLLAGLTCGDWNIKNGTNVSFSEWIVPVPLHFNSQLISLAQETTNGTIFLSGLNSTIADALRSVTMEKEPVAGTNSAAQATFKIVYQNDTKSLAGSCRTDLIGESVALEPFDLPGRTLQHEGPDNELVVPISSGESDPNNCTSLFRVSAGLDGKEDSISLESKSIADCFVHSGPNGVRLICRGDEARDDGFKNVTSFKLKGGFSEYHPISFLAKGTERNFLLQPLMSLRDETYTVYFNMGV